MLNLVEYQSWQQALQLKPAAVEIVDQIRTSPPAHRVQSGHRNVSGHYPSAKMGVTVQFETKTTQFAAILDFENDRDVLEYWDQPRVGILLPSAQSEKRRHPTAYTPPFFVLRTGSASWVECASESSIEKRCQRDPERFQKDAAGIWHDRMAETYAQQFQFRFEVRVMKPEDGLLQRNLEFLDDYLRFPLSCEPQAQALALADLIRGRPGISLREVLDPQHGGDVDLVYALIARATIYETSGPNLCRNLIGYVYSQIKKQPHSTGRPATNPSTHCASTSATARCSATIRQPNWVSDRSRAKTPALPE